MARAINDIEADITAARVEMARRYTESAEALEGLRRELVAAHAEAGHGEAQQ